MMTDETKQELLRILEGQERRKDKDKAAYQKEERRKMRAIEREWNMKVKEWLMLGWGYKPRLHDPKKTSAHKQTQCWHRIRANPKLR